MTRSERLAKEGKVEAYIGNIVIAKVLTPNEFRFHASHIHYVCSDFEALYNGKEATVNIYEDINNGEYFATLDCEVIRHEKRNLP